MTRLRRPAAHLRVDRSDDGVVVLTLDNPAQRNAMSDEMTASWVAAVDELAGDRDVRAVVVTGEGTAFCSGGNTGWIASEPDASVDHLRTRMIAFYRAWLSIRRLEVPTIAAVNGPAIGAGLCLALACDIRYAATGRELGVPFVKLGMHAGMAATYLLPNVVGPAHARDLLLTGRIVDADEALRLGLVSRVLPGRRVPRRGAGHRPRDRRDRADRRAGSPRWRCATAGTPTSSPRCSGRRWPSRSRWRPRTCRRASGPPRRSARPGSPGDERPGAGSGRRTVKRPSASPVRRLPSPCERRTDSAEGLISPNLGRRRDRVNAAVSTPVDNAGDACGHAAQAVDKPGDKGGQPCGGHARAAGPPRRR